MNDLSEWALAHCMVGFAARGQTGNSKTARAILKWANDHRQWLAIEPAMGGKARSRAAALRWTDLMAWLGQAGEPEATEPFGPLAVAARAADLLGFEAGDRALLLAATALEFSGPLGELTELLREHKLALARLLGEIAGIPHTALARSLPVQLGLVTLRQRSALDLELDLHWRFERAVEAGAIDEARIAGRLIGRRQQAALTHADFGHHAEMADIAIRLVARAAADKTPGVNILLHGPVGTGKTEFARMIAAEAGASLYAIGEAVDDDDEPDRWDRVDALRIAQHSLRKRPGNVLLFDEMEDLIGDAQRHANGVISGRRGSKVFVNRLLEHNPTPVIWTTNSLANVDPAILRRMMLVVRMDLPGVAARRAMLARIAADEEVAVDGDIAALVDATPEAISALRVAARAARLTGRGADMAASAASIVTTLRGGRLPRAREAEIDVSLYRADIDIAALVERLTAPGAPTDVSLLLSGPPGTGKTELAGHLARRMDRPLLVKRASDLLSKWVGETEQNIAEAFEEADRDAAVLLFDEADSLLFDRQDVQRSWEVSQVNEMLTRIEHHPMPVIAATNYAGRLDRAALRRFDFKLALQPMDAARAEVAFRRFFAMAPPPSLTRLQGLTAGDFAAVSRQLRFAPAADAADIAARLAAELGARPGSPDRIGF